MQDVFAMPSSVFVRDLGEYISELALNFSSRCKYDSGHYSEPLMYLECYKVCSRVCADVCSRVC